MKGLSLTKRATVGVASIALVCVTLFAATVPAKRFTKAATTSPSLSPQLELISKADPNQSSATAGALTTPQLNQRTFSADGRYVVFESSSENLIAGLSEDKVTRNIFLHDRVTNNTVLVSHAVGATTTAAGGDSFVPCISGDGRFVVYWSFGSNIIANQNDSGDSTPDVFIYDRTTGANTLISHIPGAPNTSGDSNSYDPTISADGFGSLASPVRHQTLLLVKPTAAPFPAFSCGTGSTTPSRSSRTRAANR